MTHRAFRSWLPRSLLALVSLSAIVQGQQSPGSLRGTVKHSQGAVVFRAQVTLTDVAQGGKCEEKTN